MIDIGSSEDFPEGQIREVEVQGRELGILRWQGQWYAIRNVCPHLGAPVCAGPIQSLLKMNSGASDGELYVDGARPVLMCPWHRWSFDLRSGYCLTGSKRLKTYPVRVVRGRLYVDTQRRSGAVNPDLEEGVYVR